MKNHPLPTCGDSNWLGEWAEGWLEVVDAFLWLWQWLSLKWDFFCRLFLIGIFLWFGCYHDFVGAFLMAADIMVAIFSSPAVGRVMFNSSMVATVAGSRPSTSTSCSSSTVKKTISISIITAIIVVVNTINIIVNLKHGHLLCLDLCLFSPSPPLSPLIVVQFFSSNHWTNQDRLPGIFRIKQRAQVAKYRSGPIHLELHLAKCHNVPTMCFCFSSRKSLT